MNLPPLHVWIMCQEDGSVETAHCTCMAGLGEVCSHIGALLYAIQHIVISRDSTSCTDVRALWKVPSVSKVEYTPLNAMSFGRIFSSASRKDVQGLTEVEIVDLLKSIEEAGSSSVLMRVVEPFATIIAEANSQTQIQIVNPYENMYKEEYEAFSLEELMQVASNISVTMTQEDCDILKESTVSQVNCESWFRQRIGRVTASNLKRVSRTSLNKPSLSLLKTICYPLKYEFQSKATTWGKDHEKDALLAYKQEQISCHENLEVNAVGLCLDPEYPYLGASPDSLVSCSCCGKGCVEVKCPYLLKDCSIVEYSSQKASCLTTCEEGICLKKDHAYYYQMQQQMALTGTRYCDFVVWSPTELFIERITFNEEFWLLELQKSANFHKNVILPELLGKFFTRNRVSVNLYCVCKTGDDGQPMICCDNDSCDVQWYHMNCIGLSEVPIGLWLCPSCT